MHFAVGSYELVASVNDVPSLNENVARQPEGVTVEGQRPGG